MEGTSLSQDGQRRRRYLGTEARCCLIRPQPDHEARQFSPSLPFGPLCRTQFLVLCNLEEGVLAGFDKHLERATRLRRPVMLRHHTSPKKTSR